MKSPKLTLVKKNANRSLYKEYLKQAIDSGFGFGDNLRHEIKENKTHFNKLSLEELKKLHLQFFNDLPNYFLFFEALGTKESPILFTNLIASSFDQGGMIILERFQTQIYYLYNFKGEFIDGPCHDLELSICGKYMMRSSGSRPGFHVLQFERGNKVLRRIKTFGDLDPHVSDFLVINGRDRLKLLPGKGVIAKIENFNSPTNKIEAKEILLNDQTTYYCSPLLRKYFKQDKDLARLAVRKEPLAFTLLHSTLQHDLELIKCLCLETNVCLTPYFLSYKIDPTKYISEAKIIELIKSKRLHFHVLSPKVKQSNNILLASIEFDDYFPEIVDLGIIYSEDKRLISMLTDFKQSLNLKANKLNKVDLPF